jgi:hypothetical protein
MMNNLMQELAPHGRSGTTDDLENPKGAFTGTARTLDGATTCFLATKLLCMSPWLACGMTAAGIAFVRANSGERIVVLTYTRLFALGMVFIRRFCDGTEMAVCTKQCAQHVLLGS